MTQEIFEINFNTVEDPGHLPGKADSFLTLIRILNRFPVSEGKFNFVFILKYEGKEDAAIYNPLYYLQYMVQTKGLRLITDRKAPITLINTKSGVNTDDFNFDILKVERNGKELDLKEEINKPSISFKERDNISYALCIPGYVQAGELNKFLPGTYKLTFLLSIITADNEDEATRSAILKTNPVTLYVE